MRIDWWTLALQTINVLILVWFLSRFFFRPIATIVAKRQEEANKLLSDAVTVRREADDARSDVEKMRAGVAAERDRLIMDAHEAARIEKDKLLTHASQETMKLRTEAEAQIARENAAAQEAIIAQASELATEIAQRLLSRLQSGDSDAVFVDGLCLELGALSPEQKGSFASTDPDHPFELVTATPLPKAEIDKIGSALRKALGSEPRFEVRVDPELIAGLELHGRNTVVRNSWRADLKRIREELVRAQQLSDS